MVAACNRPIPFPITGDSDASDPTLSATPPPSQTSTSTPSPIPTLTSTPTLIPTPTTTPTPTFTPTSPYIWGYFPGPSEDSELEIPPPVEPIDFPPHVVNIILLGSDRRPYTTAYRTDTLMILSLDPVANTAKMLSIPRDFYVYIPGWKTERINTAEPRGGFQMLADTILYNLGIPIDYWVRVEFSGIREAIDILGGIDVYSTDYLHDECGGLYYRYQADRIYHMDGFTAMCYTRMRKASNDFDRHRRQQEVVQAMFNKLFSFEGLWQIPDLFEVFGHTFESNIRLEDILPLAPLGTYLAADPTRIEQYRIDQTMVQSWYTPRSHAAVLLPNPEAIQALLLQAFGP